MRAAPARTVAINVSWPGASTNETVLNGSHFSKHFGHLSEEQ